MKISLRIVPTLVIIGFIVGSVILMLYYEKQQALKEEYMGIFSTVDLLDTMKELRIFLALEVLTDSKLMHDVVFKNIMTYLDEVLKAGYFINTPMKAELRDLIAEAILRCEAVHIPPKDIDSVIIASYMRDIILNKAILNNL